MAFANPLVVTYSGAAKSLNRINQDSYGAEYYLRETTAEFRVKIRHTTESPKADGTVFHRHNVEFTKTIFGTGGAADEVRQAYVVFRHPSRSDVASTVKTGKALSDLCVESVYTDLMGWMS